MNFGFQLAITSVATLGFIWVVIIGVHTAGRELPYAFNALLVYTGVVAIVTTYIGVLIGVWS